MDTAPITIEQPPQTANSTDNNKQPAQYQQAGLPKITISKLYTYYKSILSADDLEKYADYMMRPLPSTFRVCSTGRDQHQSFATCFSELFTQRFSEALREHGRDHNITPIPYCPGAWAFNMSRTELRKDPELARLHNFIILQHEAGHIVRQEAVSMTPPLFLGVKPGDTVLDMCASPGSKTQQLIEAAGSSGTVFANDADLKRAYMLLHNIMKASIPGLVVTNCDASRYPEVFAGCGDNRKRIEFDRVLADVPCTGDGTLRKAPDIIRKWTPLSAHSLHTLQIRILLRGLEMLRDGGRIVYSTCSLNPIEDEAVVAEVLRKLGVNGRVKVIDTREAKMHPEMQRADGLKNWPILLPKEKDMPLVTQEEGTERISKKQMRKRLIEAREKARELRRAAAQGQDGAQDQFDDAILKSSEMVDATERFQMIAEQRSSLSFAPEEAFATILNTESIYSPATRIKRILLRAKLGLINEKECEEEIKNEKLIEAELYKAMRFYPFYQNTGGFFVCVLEKIGSWSCYGEGSSVAPEASNVEGSGAGFNQNKRAPRNLPAPMWKELPLLPLENTDTVEKICKEFAIDKSCIETRLGHRSISSLVTDENGNAIRASQPQESQEEDDVREKKIILLSQIAKDVICADNDPISAQRRLCVVNAGISAFERQSGTPSFVRDAAAKEAAETKEVTENEVITDTEELIKGKKFFQWRIPNDSIPYLYPLAHRRILPPMPFSVFKQLLVVGLKSTDTCEQGCKFEDLADKEYAEKIKSLDFKGQSMVVVEQIPNCLETKVVESMVFTAWLGKASLGLHVLKRSRAALYQLVTGEEVEVLESKKARQKKRRLEKRKTKTNGLLDEMDNNDSESNEDEKSFTEENSDDNDQTPIPKKEL